MADYNIPFDIQEEIMKRLPIKSLLRFRSVSRPWKSFIHSSKFIAGYQQTQRLLVSYDDDNYNKKYVSIVDDDIYSKLSLVVPVSVKNRTLVSSSQGLFCLCSYYSDNFGRNTASAVIWNPTIRKWLMLLCLMYWIRIPMKLLLVLGFVLKLVTLSL